LFPSDSINNNEKRKHTSNFLQGDEDEQFFPLKGAKDKITANRFLHVLYRNERRSARRRRMQEQNCLRVKQNMFYRFIKENLNQKFKHFGAVRWCSGNYATFARVKFEELFLGNSVLIMFVKKSKKPNSFNLKVSHLNSPLSSDSTKTFLVIASIDQCFA
jgi:hypothetical protein